MKHITIMWPLKTGYVAGKPGQLGRVTPTKTVTKDSMGQLVVSSGGDIQTKLHEACELEFDDFDGLVTTLNTAVELRSGIIHGRVKQGVNKMKMRRLFHDKEDKDSGKIIPATIEDHLCPYIVLDVDDLPLPEDLSPISDPDRVIEFVRACLPAELQDVSFWYQFSASAGIKHGVAKVHLVFLLGERQTCADLQRWAKATNERLGKKLIDPSIFSPNDWTFVVPPVFVGIGDPIPDDKRVGVVRGERDAAFLNMPPAVWVEPAKRTNREQQGGDKQFHGVGNLGVAGYLKQLGPEACRSAIMSAIGAAFVNRDLRVDDAALEERIIDAMERVDDWGTRDNSYVELQKRKLEDNITDIRRSEELRYRTMPHALPGPKYETPEEANAALGAVLVNYFNTAAGWREKKAELEAEFHAKNETFKLKFCEPAPLLAIKATTGTGKTRGMIKHLLGSGFESIVYVAPTHAVLEEIRVALYAEAVARGVAEECDIIHVYGRTHRDNRTGNPTMCQRAETAEQIVRLGGNPQTILCGTDAEPLCPYFDACPYQAQAARLKAGKERKTVCLIATETLAYSLPSGVKTPDLVIIDEAFHGSLVSVGYAHRTHGALKLETMRGIRWQAWRTVKGTEVSDDDATAELGELWPKLVGMLERVEEHADGRGYFPIRRHMNMSAHELNYLRGLLIRCRRELEIHAKGAGTDDAAVLRSVGQFGELHERIRIYRALCSALVAELKKMQATRTGAVAVKDGWVSFVRSIEPKALGDVETRTRVPTIFLDADLDAEVVRRWWPDLADKEVHDITCTWSNHVRVVQVKDRSFSKTWLLGHGAKGQKEAKKHRDDLHRFVRWVMMVNSVGHEETMFIASKDVVDKLYQETGSELYEVPNDPETWRSCGWFNALAGLDRWKNVSLAIVVGRPQANPVEYEHIARAIWAAEDRDWISIDPDSKGFMRMPKETAQLHMRDTSLPASVNIAHHPDPLVDRVYRLITWSAVMQADGRIRPVYRTADNPCLLVILGDVPRGVPVDEILFWDDAKPTRFDEAVARCEMVGGYMPVSDSALSLFCPDLFPNAKAVEKARRDQTDGCEVVIPLKEIVQVSKCKVKEFKYPLHRIRESYREKGVFTNSPPIILDYQEGAVRLQGQPGKPSPWVRVADIPTPLTSGLLNVYGQRLETIILNGVVRPLSEVQMEEQGISECTLKQAA